MIPTCQVYVKIVASFWRLRVQCHFSVFCQRDWTSVLSPLPDLFYLIEPQRLPCWLWVDMLTTLSPKKLPDFLIATINKFLLFAEGKEGGVQADLLDGTHLSEHLHFVKSHRMRATFFWTAWVNDMKCVTLDRAGHRHVIWLLHARKLKSSERKSGKFVKTPRLKWWPCCW